MAFWRRISPRGAVTDLVEQWRRPQPYRWQILGLAMAISFTMLIVLIPPSQRVPPARPDVTYITTLDESRTDAEIAASNRANQARKDEAAALAAERAELRREAFRALGRASGIDVDKLERQYADDPPAPERSAQPDPSQRTGE